MVEIGGTKLDAREQVRLLSGTRVLIGLALIFAPARSARGWLAEEPSPGLVHAVRSMGFRDVALGLGTLITLDSGGKVARWLQAQAIADAGDALGTLAAFGDMPRFKRWAFLVSELGAAYMGMMLAEELAD